MRTNGKRNNSHASSTGLIGILLTLESNIPEGPEYKKYKTISMHREKFYQLLIETTTAVTTSK